MIASVTRILSITFLVVYVITAAAVPTADANTLMATASEGRQQQQPQHHQVEEGPSKRETYRKLMRSYNPIIMYHQSIRHPRFLALLTGKDPIADAAPRRMARRDSEYSNNPAAAAVYTSGARPSWNHQILQSFFRKPSSLQFMKTNNNSSNKRSSSFAWNWPEVDMDEDNNETVVNEDYADLQDNTGDDY